MAPRQIVVTGAAGFVGANLVRRLLEDGIRPHVFVRPSTQTWRLQGIWDQIHIHHIDLRDGVAIESAIEAIRPHTVYHLAAHGAYPAQQDVERIFETNLSGTINLAEACARVGVDVFVHAGSSSEYGRSAEPMREDRRIDPNSHYGIAKAAATHYCRHMALSHRLPAITLRLFSVYGPWEEPTRLIPTLATSLLEGRLPPLVAPTTARDFIHVDDVVDAFLLAAGRADLGGEVLNVGTGVQHTLEDVVRAAVELTGAGVQPVWNTMPGRSWDAMNWAADPSRAAELLGFKARIELRTGLQRSLEWFAAHRSLYQQRMTPEPTAASIRV